MNRDKFKIISLKTLALLSVITFFHINVSAGDIPTNSWVSITPDEIVYPSGFDGTYQARGFNSLVYRNSSQSILFYEGYRDAGNDPRGYSIYANCLYSFDLNTKTLTGLKISNWDYDDYGGDRPLPENTLDPTPANRHTYEQFAYVPYKDAVYIVGGANARGGSDPSLDLNDMWKYSFQTNAWTKVADKLPEWEGIQLFEGNLNYIPGYNYLFFRFGSNAYKFDLSANTWTTIAGTWTRVFGSTSTVDTNRNKIIFWGSNRYLDKILRLLSFDPDTETETVISTNPSGTLKEGGTGPVPRGKIVYHSLHDVYIMIGSRDGETWVYDPGDQTWTEIDPQAPAGYWDNDNTAYNFIAYDEANDLVVHFPNQASGSTVEVFRYSPWVTHSNPVPETMPSRPREGKWWEDPDLGGKILLLKDFSSSNGKGHHVYSDMLAFSKDNTYIALITKESGKSEQVDIYQINDNPANPVPYHLNIGTGTGTFTWATDDDDVLYYFKGTSMMKYTASSKSTSVVKDFSATFKSLQKSVQKISSNDGRYFVVGGELISGGYGSARWDKTTGALGPVIPSAWDREVIISPDGQYLIVKTIGFPCYDAAIGNFIRNLETNEGGTHSDIIMDSNGVQWIVYQHRGDGKVKKVSVPNGKIVTLVKDPSWLGFHLSARHIDYSGNKDWVIVSFFTQSLGARNTTEALEDEIVKVYLDSTETNPHYERMVKHRSEYDTGSCTNYWAQPHASVSQDGKWVIYGSNWRNPNCSLVDPYVLKHSGANSTIISLSPPMGLRIVQ